jgi:hypothetical protein
MASCSDHGSPPEQQPSRVADRSPNRGTGLNISVDEPEQPRRSGIARIEQLPRSSAPRALRGRVNIGRPQHGLLGPGLTKTGDSLVHADVIGRVVAPGGNAAVAITAARDAVSDCGGLCRAWDAVGGERAGGSPARAGFSGGSIAGDRNKRTGRPVGSGDCFVTSWMRPGRRVDASKVHDAGAPYLLRRSCLRLRCRRAGLLQQRARPGLCLPGGA